MLPVVTWILVLIASIIVLVKAADYFTESAEKIGIHFRMPSFVVGVIIVALGTSLPEILSSIVSVFADSSEVVIGNIIGSNIANICLVLGVAAVIGKNLKITHEISRVDLPLMIASTFILAISIWDGKVTLPETLLCLASFVVYVLYSITSEAQEKDKEIEQEMKDRPKFRNLPRNTVLVLLVSCFFLYIGAKYTVDSIIELSAILGIGKEIIAVSAVALGTSLPELMVSVNAARNGKPEIAIGNVLGSNIFNALAVLGIPALFGTLIIPKSMLTFGLPYLLLVTLLFFFMTQDKETTNWEGWFLITLYVFFIGNLFGLF